MADTITTPTAPDAGAQPVVAPANPYAAANAAMRAQGATWGTIAPQETEVAPQGDAEVDAAAVAVIDAAGGEEQAPEAEAAPVYEGWVVDEQGRLHRPDGSFANAGEIDQYNASIPADATPEAESAPEPIVVKLKGRDGADVEIEVTDEATAEALRTNAKDGLRGEEYRKKMAVAEEYLAERRAFETMMETNPEALILKHLPVEKQESIAVALAAKYWDKIYPHLVRFETVEGSRMTEVANAQLKMAEQEREFENLTASQKYGVQLESATRALIPEHIPDDVAEQFLADAARELGNTVRTRGQFPIDEVKTVLARRLALYGFDKPASGSPSNAPAPVPLKRPVARAVSRPASQGNAATVAAASAGANHGATVRRTVTAQRVAAAVPPAGAGAAAVRAPMVPANADLKQASQALRKQAHW